MTERNGRISFEPLPSQMMRYKELRKRLIDEPGFVNISEEMREKLEEILKKFGL